MDLGKLDAELNVKIIESIKEILKNKDTKISFENPHDEILEGKGGHKFIVPGIKSGEVKVKSVYQYSTIAEIISGDEIKVGNVVKLK